MKKHNWLKNLSFLRVITISIFYVGLLFASQQEQTSQSQSPRNQIVLYSRQDKLLPYDQKPSVKPRTKPNIEQILSTENGMKFKLGFEFQEGRSPGLCSWAANNYNIQKKPLIEFKDKKDGKVLFKVVIDSTDLEFVTEPFSDREYNRMVKCMESIKISIDVLGRLINEFIVGNVTFETWVERMGQMKHVPFVGEFTKNYVDFRKMLQEPFSATIPWEPIFVPHVTIQHPLEYTIPLCFSLFGFESIDYSAPFTASLPGRDPFWEAFTYYQKRPNSEVLTKIIENFQQVCQRKLSGLVFLHALTLVQMTPKSHQTDTDLLKETIDVLRECQQVDPKVRLTIMSRRPFSSMFEDIDQLKIQPYSYFFNRLMTQNWKFMLDYNVPDLFFRTNYAEQLFDRKLLKPKKLFDSLGEFDEDFVSEENEPLLRELLGQGVVSTTMIRHSKLSNYRSLFDDYFNKVIESVSHPLLKRPVIKGKGEVFFLKPKKSGVDMLSPPWFLESDNSMGFYRNETTPMDKGYGEAIVEIRGIREAQPWFLERCGLDPSLTGDFLKEPDLIKEHAVALFVFLYGFGNYINSPIGTAEVYGLGLPFFLRNS